jgi:hypothetical protein
MSGRLFERKKCSVTFDGRKHSGLVLDVSPGGLFVQTSAKAEPGDRLDLNLSIPGEEQMVHMQVEVARKVVVPPRLRTVAHGGIGVRILHAPEVYYTFMESLGIGSDPGEFKAKVVERLHSKKRPNRAVVSPDSTPKQAPAEPTPEPAREPNFQVRVKQTKGSRSRVLKIAADSEDEAEWKALAEVGDGWQVLDVKAL